MRPCSKLIIKLPPTFVIWLVLLCSACGTGSKQPITAPQKAPASQQVFIDPEVGVADIATFDPGLSPDFASIAAIDMVFTGLVQLDDNQQVIPQLAQSWEVSSDGLRWTFHLRPNLHFSDGTPLTSSDVAYSLDRALQPAEKSSVGPAYLALIKDADQLTAGQIKTIIGESLLTPDPDTIVILAKQKASYFLDALTYPCSYVVEKRLVQKYGVSFTDHLTEGGGDGPFKVSQYLHRKEIDFVPNPYYYGPKPQLQRVVFPFYQGAGTTFRAYQAGQVDFSSVPSADLSLAKALPNGQFHQVAQLVIVYDAMNYLVKPFDNLKIRQAFELAINKTLLARDIWKGSVIPTNHIVPQGMPGYNSKLLGPAGVSGTSGDPAKARALFQAGLQEEGLTPANFPPVRLTYSSRSSDTANEVVTLQQMWQTVLGVSVILDLVEVQRLLTEIAAATNNPHGLQFWRIDWGADYPDPQDWTSLQFCKGCPNNNMNYGQNSTSDALIQQQVQQQLRQADTLPNGPARYQAYNSAEQQLVNDVAWLPLSQTTYPFVLKPYVQGVAFNAASQIPPNDWGKIYISAH
jgi:oligopeptide transport system substrate-binding protein